MKKLLIPLFTLLAVVALGQTTVRMSAVATGTNTYSTTFNPTVSTFNQSTIYVVPFTNANSSGTVTIDPDGGGSGSAIAIKGTDGNDLGVGDIVAGGTYGFKFNGTVLRMIGAQGGSGGGGTVTSVSGTSNRITSTGGSTPVIDISASYVGQSSITTTGTLTSGATGTGFTISFTNSTLSGRVGAANLPANYVFDRTTASTAGGTVTFDCNNQNFRKFVGSASFATPKTFALSNTTNTEEISITVEITDQAAVITLPADWGMTDINFDGTAWTPPDEGKFMFGGSFDGTTWQINVAGPYNN